MSDVALDRAVGHDEVIGVLRAAARHPHKGPNDTDATMLRAAAERAAGGYQVGGSHTSAMVAKVLRLVADLIEDDPATQTPLSSRRRADAGRPSSSTRASETAAGQGTPS